jgi:ABC-type transporter Mla subunit MlaD
MVKTAPSAGRILVMTAFALSCFGLLLFLWLAFGGAVPLKPQGYRFQTSFAEATQLSQEADVRISGVSVGRVKELETDPSSGRSLATIELESRYAPLPRDARATLRQKTLLGETYVELTPGDGRTAGFLAEGGRLPAGQVSPTVELDEILRTLDPRTRADLQTWLQSMAAGHAGPRPRPQRHHREPRARSRRTRTACSRSCARSPGRSAAWCATRARCSPPCPSARASSPA